MQPMEFPGNREVLANAASGEGEKKKPLQRAAAGAD
jgi:hypothetical protein